MAKILIRLLPSIFTVIIWLNFIILHTRLPRATSKCTHSLWDNLSMHYIFIMVLTIFWLLAHFPKRPSLRVGLITVCLFLLVTCTQNRDIVKHSNLASTQNMHSLGRSLNNSCLLSSFHSVCCLIRGYEVERNDNQTKEGCLSLVFLL